MGWSVWKGEHEWVGPSGKERMNWSVCLSVCLSGKERMKGLVATARHGVLKAPKPEAPT
jgi:hypothetical protein